jgi:glycosyltransferase involved in cell wall biosynthesis
MSIGSGRSLVTVAVPSFNHGEFLDDALQSIFEQKVAVEVFVLDAGSNDNTLEVIRKWQPFLAGWRSYSDAGQAAAINEGVGQGSAPFVCWLNSDDWFLPGGLLRLLEELESRPDVQMVYGRAWNFVESTKKMYPVSVESFSERRMALRCIISQPATLIRRSAWEHVGGVDARLHMVMDYDLWWRIYRASGVLSFVDDYIAVNRIHASTKTNTQREMHYREAIEIIRKHYGSVPIKWWLAKILAI